MERPQVGQAPRHNPRHSRPHSKPSRPFHITAGRSLELLASDPHGATGDRLVIAHGFETKMLAGLDHEGLATQ
jgi:hypothetical protein